MAFSASENPDAHAAIRDRFTAMRTAGLWHPQRNEHRRMIRGWCPHRARADALR